MQKPCGALNCKSCLNGFDRVCIAVVTLYELTYGAEKHDHPIKARQQLCEFLRPYKVFEWTEQAALECAKIRTLL